jgi:hypothetical protein
MKSKYAVLATILLFPLALLAQHGSFGSAGGTSSSSSSGSNTSSSSSSSSGSHASSGGGSSASSGSSGSRGSSSSSSSASRASGGGTRSSDAQHAGNGARNSGTDQAKSNLIQSKDSNAKGKPTPGTPSAGKDQAKRSWLPWRRHPDKLAKKDEQKLKCIHGPCKVCPTGSSLNSKGVCVSAPQSAAYNCPPGSFNTGQTAGQPCTSSNLIQNNCSVLASEVQQEERVLSMISSARRPVCAQDPASQECLDLTNGYELELERLQALQAQYEACPRR